MSISSAAVCVLLCCAATGRQSQDAVLATVAGESVTEAHVQLVALLAGHREVTPKLRSELTTRLVENRYVAAYLKRSGYSVSRSELTQAVKDARLRLKAANIDLRTRLKQLRLSETDLRRELEIGKLWARYKVRAITGEKIRERFEKWPSRYDGTRVRASQIFLKVAVDDPAAWSTAEKTLKELRGKIVAGELTFAAAARKHSQSPSGQRGGDVGLFPYSGVMPPDFSSRAFALEKGEVGQPFRSRFGAHLIQVTERKPGDLSPEDARPVIYRQLEREAWNAIVAGEKSKPPLKEK